MLLLCDKEKKRKKHLLSTATNIDKPKRRVISFGETIVILRKQNLQLKHLLV